MRATPGLLGAGMAAGLMYLLGRERGKRRRSALPAAANNAARRGVDFVEEHPWGVLGAVASVLTAGMWGLRHRSATIDGNERSQSRAAHPASSAPGSPSETAHT